LFLKEIDSNWRRAEFLETSVLAGGHGVSCLEVDDTKLISGYLSGEIQVSQILHAEQIIPIFLS